MGRFFYYFLILLSLTGCNFGMYSPDNGNSNGTAAAGVSAQEKKTVANAMKATTLSITGFTLADRNRCKGPYKVWTRNKKMADSGIAEDLTVKLSASASAGFYSDAGCTKQTDKILIERQTSSSSFYFVGLQEGSNLIQALPANTVEGVVLSSAKYEVTVRNLVPEVTGGDVSTDEDMPVTGQLLATDGNSDALQFVLSQSPIKGSVNLDRFTGQFTYTPINNLNGSDSFFVKAIDSNSTSLSKKINVTIRPINDAPSAGVSNVSTLEDTPVTGIFIASDVDGDILNFSIASQPTKGQVQVTSPTLGLFRYTPNANQNGGDSFTFQVSDGTLTATNTVWLAITPVNDAPTMSAIGILTGAQEDVEFTIAYNDLKQASNAVDVDGDALSFKVTSVTSGSLKVNGSAYSGINNIVGMGQSFKWTPANNANGNLGAFRVSVVDPSGLTSSDVQVQVNVAPMNDAPTLNTIATLSGAVEDTSFSISYNQLLSASDAADIDADEIRFQVSSLLSGALSINGVPYSGGNNLLQPGGSIQWTPAANANGVLAAFSVVAADPSGAQSSVARNVFVSVNPVNDPPQASNQSLDVADNQDYSGALSINDPDSFNFSISVTNQPSKGSVNISSNGTFVYSAADGQQGADSFTYQVSDGQYQSSATVSINILPAPFALDASFGSLGKQTLSSLSGSAEAVAPHTHPSRGAGYVVAGTAAVGNSNHVFLSRLKSDGSLDTSFGNNGIVQTSVGSSSSAEAVYVLSQNEILVAGSTQSTGNTGLNFLILKYNADGALVNAFGTSGQVVLDFSQDDDKAYALTVANNLIYVGGSSKSSSKPDFAAASLNPSNGSVQETRVVSFMNGAVRRTSEALSILVYGNKIYLGGYSDSFGALAFVDFGSNDTLKTGALTQQLYALSSANRRIQALMPHSDSNRILAAGTAGNELLVMKVVANSGSLDSSFGSSGYRHISYPAGASVQGLAMGLDPSGNKIVLAGTSGTQALLYRLSPSGQDDMATVGQANVLSARTFSYGSGSSGAQACYVDAAGKTVVAGFGSSGKASLSRHAR